MPREKTPTTPTPRKRAPRKTLAVGAVAKASKVAPATPAFTPFVDPEKRSALIAEAAYFRAEKRGFAAGHETEDWLAAEAEVDANLLRGASATQA